MDILCQVLDELKYEKKDCFTFETGSRAVGTEEVTPYVSIANKSQVYLLLKIETNSLSQIGSRFFPSLAAAFRRQKFHEGEMDKNTTVIALCEDTGPLSSNFKYKILLEDDPYYFKKNIFSYTAEGKRAAEAYIQERANQSSDLVSIIDTIKDYLMDPQRFDAFKRSGDAAYRYFAEVAAKISVMPIHIPSVSQVQTINDYIDQELKIDKDTAARIDWLLSGKIDIIACSPERILKAYEAQSAD